MQTLRTYMKKGIKKKSIFAICALKCQTMWLGFQFLKVFDVDIINRFRIRMLPRLSP